MAPEVLSVFSGQQFATPQGETKTQIESRFSPGLTPERILASGFCAAAIRRRWWVQHV